MENVEVARKLRDGKIVQEGEAVDGLAEKIDQVRFTLSINQS